MNLSVSRVTGFLHPRLITPPLASCRRFWSSETKHHKTSPRHLILTSLARPGFPLHQTHCNAIIPSSRRTFVESTLNAAHSILTTLHIFTPWYLTIPLFSILFTGVFRVPLKIYSRKISLRLCRLVPVRQYSAMVSVWAAGERAKGTTNIGVERKRALALANKMFDKKYRVAQWRYIYLPMAFMPFWLLGAEAVRRIAGRDTGLLSLLPGAMDHEKIKYLADPAMTTEGFLWMPDLTAADPYHILPFLLGAGMLYRIVPRSKADWSDILNMPSLMPPGEVAPYDKRLSVATGRVLRRYLMVFSALVPWLMWDVEVALLLYWITTIASGQAISWAVKRLITSPYGNMISLVSKKSLKGPTTISYIMNNRR